jgi:MFS transporter, putative metabolite:H+ symporter
MMRLSAVPTRHRGWSLVVVGSAGASGGCLAASGLSSLLQQSARFLVHIGRPEEARATLARFGSVVVPVTRWSD